jgi:SAM-dependent methyltransferase
MSTHRPTLTERARLAGVLVKRWHAGEVRRLITCAAGSVAVTTIACVHQPPPEEPGLGAPSDATAPRDLRGDTESIRRTRLHPRRRDHLYLHLRRLRDDLAARLSELHEGYAVLDIFCGARPYEPLFPSGVNYVGLDITDAYGCADVVTTKFLPFPNATFDLCFCTQAFYFVPDPVAAVAELVRVLRPGGRVLITQPLAYPGTQRLYTPLQLRELFIGWTDVEISLHGGTVTSLVTLWCFLLHQLQRRSPRRLRHAFTALYVLSNAIGDVADRAERKLQPNAVTFPANFAFVATRP